KYVGKFYSDNYDNNLKTYLSLYPDFVNYTDNIVESYLVTNVIASYELKLESYLKNIKFQFQVNNLFDNLYASYAIGKEFFPAAERNYLIGIKIGL
ncbi:MAG: TonB-dependent receptor, partial [Ignavibacteriales bacterium]|nr:TonB-dependent receptor [Ignavibacteriales bacterium]